MPENPLLPHRKLRELHTLMLRTRELERKQKSTTAREALLAATTMQLLPGDILCSAPNDAALAALAPANRAGLIDAGLVSPPNLPFAAKLPTAASIARGQLAASPTDTLSLTIVFATSGTQEPGWQHALSVAQHVLLPLILVVTDTSAARPSPKAKSLTWTNVSAFARRTSFAVLTVDGEDAVAVYRVMQESVLRARSGGGPAIIWAIMSPTPAKPKRSQRPIARLETYLSTRNIPFTR